MERIFIGSQIRARVEHLFSCLPLQWQANLQEELGEKE